MNLRKYTKHVIFVASLLSMAALFSRCSSGGGGGAAATTFAISGNISTGQTAASFSAQKISAEAAAMSTNDVNALATQCSDGYYYNVYCVSYSEPPVSATGAVTCTGNSGAFTVAGLPLNAEIGCFVRRSSDNTTYSTLGTIEIPTTSLTGGTTSIVSQGNLQLAIALNTDGSITTEVTGGGSNVVAPVTSGASVDAAQYTGFWKIACDATATGELVDPVKCKCQNGGEAKVGYNSTNGAQNPTHIDPRLACIADNASLVTVADTEQFIELNMYKATPATPLTIDAGVVIPAGTQIPVISVWSASSGTVSARGAGGEGAATTVKDKNNANVTLAWDSAQATNAIAWVTTGGAVAVGDGITINMGVTSPMPSLTANTTAAAWKAWVASLYTNSTGFVCSWKPAGAVTDASCLAEFAMRALQNNRSSNLPSVHIERGCGNAGCNENVLHAFVFVEGLRADYSPFFGAPGDTSGVALVPEGVSPQVRNRYVFEPFEPSPTGGGFTQHNFHNQGYSCTSGGAGAFLTNKPACTGTNGNFVNCGIREETAIRFKPSSSTAMKVFFETRNSVTYASLEKWSLGVKTMGTFSEAMDLCKSQISESEGRFQMTAAKQ